MGKYEKLIHEIKNLNRNLRFDELVKVLENIGYSSKSPNSGSSHMTFRKAGRRPITIPKGYPVNKVYLELVREAISKYENEESKDE